MSLSRLCRLTVRSVVKFSAGFVSKTDPHFSHFTGFRGRGAVGLVRGGDMCACSSVVWKMVGRRHF